MVDSWFNVPPNAGWGSVFGPCFVMNYLLSFLGLQSSRRGRES